MVNQNIIEINTTKSSKFLHDFIPAIIIWIIIIFVVKIFSQSFGSNSKIILGIGSLITLSIILYFTNKQSKSYKLDMVGLTVTTKNHSPTIPWEKIESVAKVSKDEGSFMYEVLDKENNKYVFPLDNIIGRTETFLDSLPQLSIVPAKTRFDNYSARWKNISSTTYKYTSFADKFMNFSYGNPNS
ncbi:MAG: hypothetical protein UX62_C0036G0001 [Microgenomates group bacterium GW2011_GWA2_46_7]|nr:MAG: hypothetical protein UX62_C0036G0001 [Microgenomates group bacterium GW2011_GWA2_46_7]KKU46734.1 MAG: hypothetical protein UX64_C0003G0014 [Microgenomates group bacterium GW2011_GWC2_46_7]